MIKRCHHEYVDTSRYLRKEIGLCCRKCGRPKVRHESFTYSYRVKKVFKVMIGGWGKFKDIDYPEVGQAVVTLIAFVIAVVGCAVMPILSFLSPVIGYFGFLNVNRKQRNMVKRIYKKTDGDAQ